ncbi:MAG TPA: flagellar biosynthesis protein FlhB [Vicinamibacterales bacterium]
MANEERTEQPTGKKLQDARAKGQIARSRDLAVAAASIAGTIALGRLGGRLMAGLGYRLARDLAHLGDAPFRTVTTGELVSMVASGGTAIALLVGPIAMATLVAGVAIQGVQGGWNFAPEALSVDFNRLNPVNGFKRFGLMQSGMDTVKTMFSVAMIAWIAWLVVDAVMSQGLSLAWMSPVDAARAGWAHAESLMWKVAWGLAFLALGDYGLQRYRLMQSLKMTKQEVKDEAKQRDGSPEVKGRIRRIQRDMARRRMLENVPKATVVITNPTHFAVALEYRRGEMAAPKVLAKGADHIAMQIRERARKHGIPLVENKPLAQALFKTAEVGETIPAPLFSAVAEVLAQLIRLKQLVL